MRLYYYINAEQQAQGPHTLDELRALLAVGKLMETTLVRPTNGTEPITLSALLAAPPTLPALPQKQAGPCPACAHELHTTGGLLPTRCPGCGYRLRPDNPNSLWQNFLLALSKTFVLRGRATRIELWSFVLFSSIFAFIAITAMQIGIAMLLPPEALYALNIPDTADLPTYLPAETQTALIILALVFVGLELLLFVPQISATIRRLHDVGYSGWWVSAFIVLLLLPFIELLPMFAALSDLLLFHLVVSLATLALGVYLFILILLDSQRGTNQFGVSPKYPGN